MPRSHFPTEGKPQTKKRRAKKQPTQAEPSDTSSDSEPEPTGDIEPEPAGETSKYMIRWLAEQRIIDPNPATAFESVHVTTHLLRQLDEVGQEGWDTSAELEMQCLEGQTTSHELAVRTHNGDERFDEVYEDLKREVGYMQQVAVASLHEQARADALAKERIPRPTPTEATTFHHQRRKRQESCQAGKGRWIFGRAYLLGRPRFCNSPEQMRNEAR